MRPGLSALADLVLLSACIGLGLMAGFFWTYWINVAPALVTLDGATYADVQSRLNVNVRHGVFFAGFFGTGILVSVATVLYLFARRFVDAVWLGLAALLYVGMVILFTGVHILPMNATTEAWDPLAMPAGWDAVRDGWNAANRWRAIAALTAFGMAASVLMRSCNDRPGRGIERADSVKTPAAAPPA